MHAGILNARMVVSAAQNMGFQNVTARMAITEKDVKWVSSSSIRNITPLYILYKIYMSLQLYNHMGLKIWSSWGVVEQISKTPSRRGLQKSNAQLLFSI